MHTVVHDPESFAAEPLPPVPPAIAPSSLRKWVVALVLIGLAALTHIDGLFGPLHCDGSAWLYMAQQRDNGLLPYRDLWENKLPPIFLVYRLAWKSGCWRLVLYAGDVCLIAGSGWYLWRVALTFMRTGPALTAAILYILATAHPALHYGAAITEAYALPLAVLGFSFAALYRHQGGRCYPVLAGCVWAWAVCFRMPAVLSGLCIVPLLLAKDGSGRVGTRQTLLVGMIVGAALGLVPAFIDSVIAGYWSELIDVCVVWAFRYATHDTPSLVSWSAALGLFAQNLTIWGGLHLAAILGLLCGLAQLRGASAWRRVVLLSLLCWYLGDLLSTFPTLHQYPHNHYMTLASVALAAALFCDVLSNYREKGVGSIFRVVNDYIERRTRARPARIGLATAFVPGAILIGYAFWTWMANIWPKTDDESAAPGVIEAAEYLRRSTEPGERVLLWVWLEEAELLWRLGRPAASRHFSAPAYFMTDVELAHRSAAQMLAAPPRYAADSSPYVPLLGMPGDVIPETPYERIRARYRDLYEPVARFGRISVYRRKTAH